VTNLPTNRAGVVTADTIRNNLGCHDKPIPARMTTQQVATYAHVTAKAVTPLVRGGPGPGCGHVFSGADVAAFLNRRAIGGAR
jgi:hypothetical protein